MDIAKFIEEQDTLFSEADRALRFRAPGEAATRLPIELQMRRVAALRQRIADLESAKADYVRRVDAELAAIREEADGLESRSAEGDDTSEETLRGRRVAGASESLPVAPSLPTGKKTKRS